MIICRKLLGSDLHAFALGGIGVELTSAMNLFRYNEALTIILSILVVVIAVEQVAGAIRRRVI